MRELLKTLSMAPRRIRGRNRALADRAELRWHAAHGQARAEICWDGADAGAIATRWVRCDVLRGARGGGAAFAPGRAPAARRELLWNHIGCAPGVFGRRVAYRARLAALQGIEPARRRGGENRGARGTPLPAYIQAEKRFLKRCTFGTDPRRTLWI